MTKLQSHHNNFNLIRLMAAMQVLLVHSMNHFGMQSILVDIFKATPGVPIFFFISGYLIGASYIRKHHLGAMPFFTNRFLRVYPGLLICVILSISAVAVTGYFQDRDIGLEKFILWFVGQITIFQFYNPDFMRLFGTGVLNGALWTIAVELQFYFLVPLIFILIERRPRVLALVFLLSLAVNIFLRAYADDRTLMFKLLAVSFAPWLYMFLFGFVVAYSSKLVAIIKRMKFTYLLLAYGFSMTVIGGYSTNAQNSINPIAFFLLACLVFKVATFEQLLPAKLSTLVNKSDFSYGLYLYHMPVINVLLFLGLFSNAINITLTIVISVMAASLSWFFIEKPSLKLKI